MYGCCSVCDSWKFLSSTFNVAAPSMIPQLSIFAVPSCSLCANVQVCDKHDPAYYEKFKKECDE